MFSRDTRVKVRYLGPSRAWPALDLVLNTNQVALVEKDLAQELLAAGDAVRTDDEFGEPPPLTPDRECWHCGGGGLGFADAKCRWCGQPV